MPPIVTCARALCMVPQPTAQWGTQLLPHRWHVFVTRTSQSQASLRWLFQGRQDDVTWSQARALAVQRVVRAKYVPP